MTDSITRLYDLAMTEMKRRRPEFRNKSASEIMEILAREHGMPEPDDLAYLVRLLGPGDPDDIERIAKALGHDGADKETAVS
jgi:hypothetical protein